MTTLTEWFALIDIDKGFAASLQCSKVGHEIIAINIGDLCLQALGFEYFFNLLGQSSGIKAARIGHNFNAAIETRRDHFFKLFQKGADVTQVRAPLLALIVENLHGQLG